MKSKDSPNLYEILRTASRSSTATETAPPPETPRSPAPAAEPHEPTLQERLAIYKAGKLGLAASAPAAPAAAEAPETPAPETPQTREEMSAPVPKPPEPAPRPAAAPKTEPLTRTEALLSHPAPAAKGTGERVLKVTYNTAAFSALVGLGLLFVAYSLGVRAGRSGAPEPSPEAAARASETPAVPEAAPLPPKPAPVPAPAPRVYSLRLAEWPYKTAQDRLKANAAADEYKKALAKAGLAGSESMAILRGQEPRLALFLGRHADPNSAPAKAALAAAQKVKVQTQTPFGRAQFEELPR